jgi:glutaredoxin-like protein
MALLSEKDQSTVGEAFDEQLEHPVNLVLFTYSEGSEGFEECQYCEEMQQLAEEIAALSDQIDLVVCDFDNDVEKRESYGVVRAPALVIAGSRDHGLRYYGIPSGYEAQSFIEDIIDVGRKSTDLSQNTRDWLKDLKQDVHLQVFVTPTCPHCPSAARLAHQLALESDYVTGDVIEAMEFPELSREYDVYGVPRVVINEDHGFEGALPEENYIAEITKALGG